MRVDFEENMKLDRRKWAGLQGVSEDHYNAAESNEMLRASLARLEEQMDEAEVLLKSAAEPRFTYKIIDADRLEVTGESLALHLEGCDRLVLMAVTLGREVDEIIEETVRRKVALGVTVDSGASIMAEAVADFAESKIRADIAGLATDGEPLFITERFSPGYGDSPLQMQKQVLETLDAERELGITLSKAYMMRPSKSITAIMGLADHPVTGRPATCAECVLRDKCMLKKEGKRCYSTSHK